MNDVRSHSITLPGLDVSLSDILDTKNTRIDHTSPYGAGHLYRMPTPDTWLLRMKVRLTPLDLRALISVPRVQWAEWYGGTYLHGTAITITTEPPASDIDGSALMAGITQELKLVEV